MEMLKPVLASTVLFLIAANGIAAPTASLLFDQNQCGSNCVLSLRSANNLIVVARNREGAIFKTLSFAMPGDARLLYASDSGSVYLKTAQDPQSPSTIGSTIGSTSASANGDASECVNLPGVCTDSDVRSYVTPGYYIFYTYTYVFNNGNLIEINVEENRIARNIIN